VSLISSLPDSRSFFRQQPHKNLHKIRLFGSKARGDGDPYSDIDVLVIVKNRHPEVDDLVLDAAFKVSLDCDVVLSPVVFSHNEYYAPLARKTLFYQNTQVEGVPL
jgi:predicted nucleotidyltransferase